jgi:very-short-patch-repair endonuclease
MAKFRGREDYPFYFGAGPELLRLAGELRKSMTQAEKVLWENLRNKKINGVRFRRQHPISEFIVDFFSYEALLVIEIDGAVHQDPSQSERDTERTKILAGLGIKEIRFSNEEVIGHLDQVIKIIESELSK